MANERQGKEEAQEDETNALLRELVEANNRTNHAVRAIALPSTVMLITLLLSAPLLSLALWAEVDRLVLLAAFILIVGSAVAILAQIVETRLSEIPESAKQQSRSAARRKKCRSCGRSSRPGNWTSCPYCGRH